VHAAHEDDIDLRQMHETDPPTASAAPRARRGRPDRQASGEFVHLMGHVRRVGSRYDSPRVAIVHPVQPGARREPSSAGG